MARPGNNELQIKTAIESPTTMFPRKLFALVLISLIAAGGQPGFADGAGKAFPVGMMGVQTCHTVAFAQVALAPDVPKFGMFEHSFKHTGRYENPYVQLTATVLLAAPDGKTRTIPLFWDGGTIWRFRFAPHTIGTWKWSVESSDPGLNGQSGSFRVVDSQNQGGIQPMKGQPYHFQRQDGTPFWFMGDTAWALYTDSKTEKHDRGTVKKYIDVRAGQGFNVIHSMLLSEAGWGNRGGDAFGDLDAEKINPEYWQEVDVRLAYLNSKGITGGLVLAWADKGRNPNDWKEFPSTEARHRYARYVAARYGAFNVYFIVAGEWHFDGASEKVKSGYVALGNVIRQSDPHRRMIAIHPGGPGSRGSVEEFTNTPWMSFGDYQQNYRNLHASVLDARKHDRPVVNAEYGYHLRDRDGDGKLDKPNSASVESIRHATWDIVMAGGCFITGFGTTYFGGNRDPGPFDVDAARNNDWEQHVQHVKKLFSELTWWRLEPHDELITSGLPRGTDGKEQGLVVPPRTTYWALAEPGRQYVAYVRGHQKQLQLSLGSGRAGTYKLRQFDPRTGAFDELGTYTGKGPIDYTPPDDRDWVLLVTAVTSGECTVTSGE